jgi:hypothetical protein
VNTGQDPHLTVESGEIRADDPDGGRQARSGHSYLRLSFAAVNGGPGVFAIVYQFDHSLRLPSGAVVGASPGCGRPQAHPTPYASSPDHAVCFEVPEPSQGSYLWYLAGAELAGLRFTVG